MNDYNVVYLRKLRRKTNNKPVFEKHVVLLFTSRARHYVNNGLMSGFLLIVRTQRKVMCCCKKTKHDEIETWLSKYNDFDFGRFWQKIAIFDFDFKIVTALEQIWKSRITIPTKLKLYNTCILPIFLYGSVCWAVTKRDVLKIDALDQWCLRKLLGIKWYHHMRNDELRQTTGQPRLSAIV